MKKGISFIFITLLISSLGEIGAAQRRVGAQITRKVINKPINKTSALKHSPTIKFKSRSSCPQTVKKGIAQMPIASHKRTQFQEFAQKHRKKLLITGITSAACAGKTISYYLQQKKITKDLQEFHDLLISYDDNKQSQQNLDSIILRLHKNKGINKSNENDDTPLMMTIAAIKLKPKDRKKILNSLISYGAKPDRKEFVSLINAINLTYKNNIQNPTLIQSAAKPYIVALKILLPHYNQDVLHDLIKEVHRIIHEANKEFLTYKLAINNRLRDNRNAIINYYEEKINSPAFTQFNKKEQEKIQKMYTTELQLIDDIFYTQQKTFHRDEQELKLTLKTFKRVDAIAKKALDKGKLSGTSAYKEVD